MTTAVRPRKRARPPKPPTDGWWGDGAAPWERWPGVTIRLDATWSGDRWESPCGRYYFDTETADKAVEFFPTFLRHHIGEFAGDPFVLMPYQELLLTRPLFGWKRVSDGLRRFRKLFAFIPKGAGKALAIDTPIATPSGWTTMGEISVGDALFDEHGTICHVTRTSDVMVDRPCYRVEFSDGTSIVADAEHLWQTTAQRKGLNPGRSHAFPDLPRLGQPSIVTTEEIARTLRPPPTTSLHPQAKWNHRVEVAGALKTEGVALPIPPYTLGAWLGDGDSDCARLTMAFADTEITDAIAAEGVEVRQQQPHSETTGRFGLGARRTDVCYRGHPRGTGAHCLACERETDYARRHGVQPSAPLVLSLNASLRSLDLLGNKHIPPLYLRASIEQRLALLQGLMDTDGYIDTRGKAEFCVTDERLADDTLELLRTLGYKARVLRGRAAIRGRIIGPRYRISFTPEADRPVFRLARKLNRIGGAPFGRRLGHSRRIVGCSPVASVPVRCIGVDSPSQLFLAGEAMIPTHNSPWASGTALYLTLCDDEPAAEVYAVAADRQQARIVHDNAKVMVETSPDLADMCEVLRDAIYVAASRSKLEVLSSDATTKHGFRPHGVVFDEFHAQPKADLYEALERSMIKRREPLMIIITHAGEDDEGICYEEYELAKQVLSGTIAAPTSLPVIFEAKPDDPWDDPATWLRVNPGHGVTVKHDAIETECADAQAAPRKKNGFLRYHLNRWVNDARAWMPVDWWDACKGPIVDSELQELSLAGGLDMAQKYDLASFVVTFKTPLDGPEQAIDVVGTDEFGEPVKRSISLNYRIATVPFFWIPKDTMQQHEKTDRVPYGEWARLGLVRATEGNVIDYNTIYRDITGEITTRFPRLRGAEIGYDPAFATDIAMKLKNAGYQMVEVLQNYKHISEASHVFESLVRGKRCLHDGHRVLRWNMENVTIRQDDAGRIRPVKPRRATRRIDGVVAAVMGVSRLMVEASSGGWDVAGFDLPGA